MSYETFKVEVDADGVALVTFDVPGRTMNTLTAKVMQELPKVVDQIVNDDKIVGAVITSGKDTGFCAGADLGDMNAQPVDPNLSGEAKLAAAFERSFFLNKTMRSLETCGKPWAAAINGLALGGGLELCLACHARFVADNPKINLGLPEALVGLFPGGGGTQRLPRMIGAMNASQYLLQGKNMNPQKAKELGVVNEVVPADQLVETAKAWVREPNMVDASNPFAGAYGIPKQRSGPVNAKAFQPWDVKGYKIPGGGPYHPAGMQVFMGGNAMVAKETNNNYPAQKYILRCLYEGLQVPMDAALRIESRYFAKNLMEPSALNMVRTLFLSKQALEKGARRPADVEPKPTKKLCMLGAGLMGGGITYASAKAGIDVVVLDINLDNAKKAVTYAERLLDKDIERGRMTEDKKAAFLARIHPTDKYEDIKDCDLVIEAVFENREIKAKVTQMAEAQIGPDAVFGSNTSTLPITGLAEASERPANFIGIHFFSPVEKMPLVEIIMGEKTGPEALAKALDYCRQIRYTPIVVNDSRGFYTSRVVGTYIGEGLEILSEGVPAALLENLARQAGMPMGPLQLNDLTGIDLGVKIFKQTAEDLGQDLETLLKESKVAAMGYKMAEELGRTGQTAGKGWYDYTEPRGKKTHLWPGIDEVFPPKYDTATVDQHLDYQEIQDRLLTRQALETARCVEEGVLVDPRDGDVGSIFAFGFPPYTGGTLSYIDTIGLKAFVERCDRFAAKYGERFQPTQQMRDMAAKGETFYSKFGAAAQAA